MVDNIYCITCKNVTKHTWYDLNYGYCANCGNSKAYPFKESIINGVRTLSPITEKDVARISKIQIYEKAKTI